MITARQRLVLLLIASALLWVVGATSRLAVVSALLLFGPGFLLERTLLPLPNPTPFARPTIWLGFSVSVIALLYQWVTFAGLTLNTVTLGVLATGCGLGIVAQLWQANLGTSQPRRNLAAWCLGSLLALTFCLRLYQIRDLALPNWVDSVHHALMIRVAIERGQAPFNLTPYLPVTQLPYHWGYHVVTAASVQLSGVSLPQVMLWQGQLLSALHGLTVAALTAALWRKPWASIVAAVIVGFVSLMPAFYTSWGRYTQLLGLLLLPPLTIGWQALLAKPTMRQLVCVAVLLAGLNLVHFRVLIFALCLLGALTVVRGLGAGGWGLGPEDAPGHLFARSPIHPFTFGACALAVVLTAPWLWLLAARQLRVVVAQPGAFFSGDLYGSIDLNLLWSGPNRWLVALALLGALVGIWRRSGAALTITFWLAGLFALANPQVLPYLLPAAAVPLLTAAIQQRKPLLALAALPLLLCNPLLLHPQASWLITNDVIVIALFVPLGVLIGGLVELMPERWRHSDTVSPFSRLPCRRVAFANGLLVATLLGAAAWGAWSSRDLIRPSTVLATAGDVAAIEWAAHNTPPDARFLIGATPWLGNAARGVDGGWWLLPLTGRWVTTPPVLFVYGPAAYVQETIQRSSLVAGFQPSQVTALQEMLVRDKISYVYLTKQTGAIAQAFGDVQRFPIVYQGDGVRILAVKPQP